MKNITVPSIETCFGGWAQGFGRPTASWYQLSENSFLIKNLIFSQF